MFRFISPLVRERALSQFDECYAGEEFVHSQHANVAR